MILQAVKMAWKSIASNKMRSSDHAGHYHRRNVALSFWYSGKRHHGFCDRPDFQHGEQSLTVNIQDDKEIL